MIKINHLIHFQFFEDKILIDISRIQNILTKII